MINMFKVVEHRITEWRFHRQAVYILIPAAPLTYPVQCTKYFNFPVIKKDKPLRILYRIKGNGTSGMLQVNGCINKMQYTHTMEYYLGIQRNEVLIHATRWIKLENMMFTV